MTTLDEYRPLGRSGLKVSPIALGTMTFGAEWGADETESRRIFDTYVDRGGNFVDTAGFYAGGLSEEMVGRFSAGRRNQLVLATKYSLNLPAHINAAGNGRKSMVLSVEDSLRRLGTDYLDLLFLHFWDDTAPADEVLRAFDDLVSQGKVLYIGLSDTPAWQAARLQTMAELRGWTQFAGMQMEYSLVHRSVERDLIPAARALGMGVLPWSPIGGGLLSGAYATKPRAVQDSSGGRGAMLVANKAITPDVIAAADAAQFVADALGASSPQVALAWTLANPAVSASIVGARTLRQFEESLGGLVLDLCAEHLAAIDAATRPVPGFPERMLHLEFITAGLTGGNKLTPRPH